jgi:hypothetical protein
MRTVYLEKPHILRLTIKDADGFGLCSLLKIACGKWN